MVIYLWTHRIWPCSRFCWFWENNLNIPPWLYNWNVKLYLQHGQYLFSTPLPPPSLLPQSRTPQHTELIPGEDLGMLAERPKIMRRHAEVPSFFILKFNGVTFLMGWEGPVVPFCPNHWHSRGPEAGLIGKEGGASDSVSTGTLAPWCGGLVSAGSRG